MSGVAQKKGRFGSLAMGIGVLALLVGTIVLLFARWRSGGDLESRAIRAYDDRDWTSAAELARQNLATHKDDPAALTLFARASARQGRDSTAMSIYERKLDQKRLELEDFLLLGIMLDRQGRRGGAALAWKKVLEAEKAAPESLEELTRLCVQTRRFDEAILAATRLSLAPKWQARGFLMLGTIHVELNDIPAAAGFFRQSLDLDRAVVDASTDAGRLRKLIARTFLRVNRADEALAVLKPIFSNSADPEAEWLASRVYLQSGQKSLAIAALGKAGAYRAKNPLEPEPSPYVGEARCEGCHVKIYRDSLSNRHTQTYYRPAQLDKLPLPEKPLPDPDDPKVTHVFANREGTLHQQTKVGQDLFDAVIEHAFGTPSRYLTMVSRDSNNTQRIARLSYHDTPEGKGWDRSSLDMTHPTLDHPAEFQGEPVGVRVGLAKCFYCHVTNPRTGNESPGPELFDRAIGCERCHGPGGNHIAALETGLPDLAIVSPSTASPQLVSTKQCNDCHVLEHKIPDGDLDNPGWIRSQGIGWSRSRCNTESGGAFGCVTCHDPHRPASATARSVYESKCLECHAATTEQTAGIVPAGRSGTGLANRQSPTCPVNASKGCLGCHMPKVRDNALHLELTDHYIRVRREK